MGLAKDNLREYNRIHKWISRHFDKSGICEYCFKTCRTQWSNKSGRYTQIRIDWQELCPKCHRRYDEVILGVEFITGRKIDPNSANSKLRYIKELKQEAKGLEWGNKHSLLKRLENYAWFRG